MGTRGPVPKRTDQRRRVNKPTKPTAKAAGAKSVTIPRPDPGWHPAAKRFYAALQKSGQAKFYEPSDWQLAWLTSESLSRDLKPQVIGINETTGKPVFAIVPLKGASLAAYLKAFNALLVTEGDRRRLGIELERSGATQPDTGDVPSLDDYRKRLTG